jgi:type I restriction enzyme S subunit
MDNKNIPEVRFKGFTEEWNEEFLDNLAKFSKGQGYSKGDLREKGNPIILYGNLYTNYQTVIKEVNTYAALGEGAVLSKGGEVIIPSSGETAEDIVRASKVELSNVILGGDLNVITPNKELASTFLALNISNGSVYNKLTKKAQGKSVVHIRNSDLQETPIYYPKNKTEQTKIGSFFENLDQLISQHQKQHKKLNALKKAMLSKLFPKQGQTVPEIRFKGFNGDWEVKRLGEICYITTGKLDANAMSAKGKYRFYTCAREYYRIDTFAFDVEALLISGNGANVGYIHYYKGKFNAYQRTYILTQFNEDVFYIKQFLNFNLSDRIMSEKKEGNTPYIVLSTLSEMKIKCPVDKKEQQQIGNYFKNLDSLIENHSKQIEKLGVLKKACLSKMFV